MARTRRSPVSPAAPSGKLAALLDRAADGKERVVLARRGKAVAAVVPIEDVDTLEAIDDARDSALIRRRVREWRRGGKSGVTIEEFAAKHAIRLPASKR